MKNFVFGFSLPGLLLYILQLLPNLIWMLAPPADNVLTENSSPYPLLNGIERIFGVMTVVILLLIKNKSGGKNSPLCLGLAALFLLGYYAAWIVYYAGAISPWMLIIGIAAMPPLYFFFAGLWMKNYVVLIPCILFGIAHIAITGSTYLRK